MRLGGDDASYSNAAKNLFWEIDPTTGTATSHSVSPQASPSSGYATAFYDATLGGVVFIGSVTYVWNATTKQLVMAYDTKNEQLLVLLYNGLLYARPSR